MTAQTDRLNGRPSAPPYFWLLLILLVAASLRLAALADVPPGLTHDEADHGLDAWGVVNGIRPIYFTVGFGREPLYDYATAGVMAGLGRTYLAGRLTAVFFSLIAVAGTYAWASRAFGRRVALLTAAGLAVSFWGVMTGRQALRSVALPALFVLAAVLYWRGVTAASQSRRPFFLAGLLLGATIYTYVPARILWAIFPAHALYLTLASRRQTGRERPSGDQSLRRLWTNIGLLLLVMAVVAAPLLLYLIANPAAETRLAQLSDPLTAATAGDWQPLLRNAQASLQLFTVRGDPAWRYNLPGRPWLDPLLGALFYAGLALAAWRVARPWLRRNGGAGDGGAAFFALTWLAAGLSPSLVTGPSLSTTQAIGLQPVLFLFPAMTLAALYERLPPQTAVRRSAAGFLILYFGLTAATTARDYFVDWANAPEVRVQYETTLVAAVNYLARTGGGPAAISTTTPGPFHSPAVAVLLDHPAPEQLRWFDGQHSLVLPDSPLATAIFSGFASLDTYLAGYFGAAFPIDILPLRPTDRDRPLEVYLVNGQQQAEQLRQRHGERPADPVLPASLGETAVLTGYDLLTPRLAAGETFVLVTMWQAIRPSSGELVLFTHLLGPSGQPAAQADRLDAPAELWRPGDTILQLHRITLPADLSPGDYPLAVGLYRRSDGRRLPASGGPDQIRLPAVTVTAP